MEKLRRENERLKQENQELRELLKIVTERLAAAEQKIKELSEQLKQNSRNSNWPSSRDKSRRKTKSLRSKSERKAGGQEGHEGHTLAFNPEPDVIKKHRPTECEHCQAPLAEAMAGSEVAKRQVLDLPPLRYVTTEHQAETVLCPSCGEATRGEFRPVSPTQSSGEDTPTVRKSSVWPSTCAASNSSHMNGNGRCWRTCSSYLSRRVHYRIL